ncbi:MAG: tetratricopeptide repeat protein [Lacipirellulaceae bacterium]
MQRYRVNFPLLVTLVVGTIALLGGTYGLYRFQASRNADQLLTRAAEAKEEGDSVERIRLLGQYLSLRKDDEKVMAELANAYADLTEEPDVEPQDIGNALGLLENTVREQPKNDLLRRRLVDLLMKYGQLKPAIDHIAQLLNQKPRDPELEGMKSQCLFAVQDRGAVEHAYTLVGYDEKEDKFDVEKAIAPKAAIVYGRIASVLRTERSDGDLADRFVNQMIDANPEDGTAYLLRAQYLEGLGKKDESSADLKKALEVAPTDAAVVAANARLAVSDSDYDGARKLVEGALDKHPEDPQLYQTLAFIDGREGDYAKALKAFDRGIKAVPTAEAQMLYFSKARVQIERDDRAGAQATINAMRKEGRILKPYLDYLEARLLVASSKWYDASVQFEKLQGFMSNVSDINPELNFLLGFCYEKLGQNERALATYRLTLQSDPSNTMAGFGIARVESAMGQTSGDTVGVTIYDALGRELAKPKAEQDWAAFQEVVDRYAEKLKIGDAMKMVLEGEVLMRRGLYEQARTKLMDAYKEGPKDLAVRRAAVKLFAMDPDQGPAKALKLLDKVVEEWGDKPILRLERADLLSQINDENLSEQLYELSKGMEKWSPEDQVQVWNGLAGKFERLRDREATQECLTKVAELTPGDLATLLRMFLAAREADDDAGMKTAQDRILVVVKRKENENWLFCEAHRLVSRFRSQQPDKELLDEAMILVDRALGKRGEWNQLHLLKAEVALLRGDAAGALASFDRAAQLGRPTALSLYQHVKLLGAQGRFGDAVREIEKVTPEVRVQLLGQDYADGLLATGRVTDAIAASKQIDEIAGKNDQTQLWLGQFLSRASTRVTPKSEQEKSLVADAGKAFEKAVELNPQLAEGWLSLVGYYAATAQPLKAEDALRGAQLALVEDQTQLMFARCYELLGRAMDAESMYRKAYESSTGIDKTRAGRLLAQYYLGNVYQRDDKVARATPIINQILRDTASGGVPATDENARWARNSAARLLAGSGEYQKLIDAERLLSSNLVNGQLAPEDQLLMAEILAPRPEPVSRLKAAALYESLQQRQPLTPKNELDLGKLYYALGDWRKCREQMVSLTAKYPADANLRATYVRMLVERGGPTEIDAAVRQLDKLADLAPNSVETRELLARVSLKRGKKAEAAAALRGMLPRDLQTVKDDQLPLVFRVAQLLTEFKEHATAEPLYNLAAEKGGKDYALEYANFVGAHVDAERGLKMLGDMKGDVPAAQLVQRGLAILRAREAEGTKPDWFTLVGGWLEAGLRDDPESVPLLLERAELLDVEGKYKEAADAYRKMLEGTELVGMSRAVVLNNLAYLLALSQTEEASMSEARRYCDEAVQILGPQTDILDTRGVISIAAGRYEDAISDLTLAVIDSPTASKHFHKALAQLGAGKSQDALASWEEATRLGLERDKLPPMERTRYDKAKGELEGLGLRSAQL